MTSTEPSLADSAEDQEEKQDGDGGTRVIRVFHKDLGAAEDARREHDRGRDARAEQAGAAARAAPGDQRGQQDGERVGERAAEVHHIG